MVRESAEVRVGHLANQRSARQCPPCVKLGASIRYRLGDIRQWEEGSLEVADP